MSFRMRVTMLAATGGMALIAACQKSMPKAPETTAAAKRPSVAQAGSAPAGVFELFDSARAAFGKQDTAKTAKALRDAATLLRAEVDTVPAGAKRGLRGAATGLESIAMQVDKGRARNAKALDLAFARTHQAEAESRLLAANAAWTATKSKDAGMALAQAGSHFETASTIAEMKLDPASLKAIANVRRLAVQLSNGASVPPREYERTTKAFGMALTSFTARLGRQKG